MKAAARRGAYMSQTFGGCNTTDSSTCGLDPHTVQPHTGKPLLNFLSLLYFFFFSFYPENSMMRQSDMKYKIMLKNETPRLGSTQLLERAEHRINSIVANDATRPKLEGYLVANVQKGESTML